MFARLATLCLAVVLAGACLACAPAWAASKDADEPLVMQMTGESQVSLGRIDIKPLPVTTTPDVIVTGVPCGMVEMCGQDPCLCGATDEYGSCACNGRVDTRPQFSLTCDQDGVVALVSVFDRWFLVSLGTGSTEATLTASLPHYEEASMSLSVTVEAFSVLDVLKIIVGVAVVLALLAALVFVVRALVRGVVRLARTVRRRMGETLGRRKRGGYANGELDEGRTGATDERDGADGGFPHGDSADEHEER